MHFDTANSILYAIFDAANTVAYTDPIPENNKRAIGYTY